MFAIAIPAGLLIGLSLGALGGGGSILTVPALVYLLHQQPHAATTGSLIIVGITALAGVIAHQRAGRVRVAQGVTFGVLGVAGSFAGTRLSAGVAPDLLLTLFAVLMLAAAAAMLRRRRRRRPPPGRHRFARRWLIHRKLALSRPAGSRSRAVPRLPRGWLRGRPGGAPGRRRWTEPPGGAAARRRSWPAAIPGAVKIVTAATAVGLLTGFFGVGGGFVIVPALVLALGFEMPAAVGTSLLVIAINSAASLAARLGGHVHLDWPLLAVFTVAALAGAVAGNRVACRVDASRLTAAFAVLLAAVAVYSLGRSLPGLV